MKALLPLLIVSAAACTAPAPSVPGPLPAPPAPGNSVRSEGLIVGGEFDGKPGASQAPGTAFEAPGDGGLESGDCVVVVNQRPKPIKGMAQPLNAASGLTARSTGGLDNYLYVTYSADEDTEEVTLEMTIEGPNDYYDLLAVDEKGEMVEFSNLRQGETRSVVVEDLGNRDTAVLRCTDSGETVRLRELEDVELPDDLTGEPLAVWNQLTADRRPCIHVAVDGNVVRFVARP
jgi:hypothetical protein